VKVETLDTYRLRAKLPAHFNLEGKGLNKEIKLARKRLEAIREKTYDHRHSWLESLEISNDITKEKDPERSRILKQIVSREEWHKRYRKCQELMGSNT